MFFTMLIVQIVLLTLSRYNLFIFSHADIILLGLFSALLVGNIEMIMRDAYSKKNKPLMGIVIIMIIPLFYIITGIPISFITSGNELTEFGQSLFYSILLFVTATTYTVKTVINNKSN